MAIRILLADDHPIFRAGLRSLLDAQPDMEILAEVADGLAAVEAARALKPDVAVIDVSMPGMNGLEATQRITTEAPGIKVLCLSMHSDRRFVDAAIRSGAHGYLLKECASEELVGAIHAGLAGQIYTSPGLADAVPSREREILQLLAEGHSAHEIAARLHVSVKTVGTHREHLMQKLGTRSLAGLTKFAIREGLTSAEE